jgi:hypothetical protein
MTRLRLAIAVASVAGLPLWKCASPVAPEGCQINQIVATPSENSPARASAICANPGAEGRPTTVAVSVSAGLTPRFDWTPQHGITHLAVTSIRSDGQAVMVVWSFSASPLATVGPTVHFGLLPQGATLEGPTLPLVRGTSYRVTLERIIGGDAISVYGAATFTP